MSLQQKAESLTHVERMDIVVWHIHPGPVQLVGRKGDIQKLKHGGGAVVVEPKVLSPDDYEDLGLV